MSQPPGVRHLTKTLHRSQYAAIDPANPANSAAGKIVLVTSGASGIGYAIARGFAFAGASTVILLARRAEILTEAAAKLRGEAKPNTEVWTYQLDIRDKDATEGVFASIRTRLNQGKGEGVKQEERDVDVLVASAAVFAPHDVSVDYAPDAIRASFETNVVGNMNVVRAFLAPEAPAIPLHIPTRAPKDTSGLRASGREKIILDVSSIVTFFTVPGLSVYGASKIAFTRLLANVQAEVDKMEGSRIRVHSFHPGGVFTPSMQRTGFKEEHVRWDDESLPAGFAVWLASPAAAFLKGRFVLSAWDVDEMMAMKEKFAEDPDLCRLTLNV